MKEFSLNQVQLTDNFWKSYQTLVRQETIPYQYQVLNDEIEVDVQAERKDDTLPAGKSHALANLRIAAGEEKGEHFGWFFQDSDVYKWLESVAYSLINHPDPVLEAQADEVIELIGAAQEEDGYLNTFFQLTRPKLKYKQLYFSHELYCAGHLIEAAIAYDQATGKTSLLTIAEKFVANIAHHFGPESAKIQGADGHQEIELALVRLYEHTHKQKYLELADFFLMIRGKDPQFYQKEIEDNLKSGLSEEQPTVDLTYLQAYAQPKDQTTAVGHAVRLLYMATGMAKVAQHTQDQCLIEACQKIWADIYYTKMYVTGGVGSTVHGEAFVGSYDLPNDTMYCETCAAIALVNFSFELFKLTKEQRYLDCLERTLCNSVLSGASIDGKHFFYVNPLEVIPDSCRQNPGKGHVKTKRPDWLGCACCPPNFARLISSVQRFIYTVDEEIIYLNLFAASELVTETFTLSQSGNFPYEDRVRIRYQGEKRKLAVRKPNWLSNLQVIGTESYHEDAEWLYFEAIEILEVTLFFEQPVRTLFANPLVSQDVNQVALQRGPFVYCLESADNGQQLWRCRIDPEKLAVEIKKTETIWQETVKLSVQGYQANLWQKRELYRTVPEKLTPKKWQLIPYHLWGNRGEGEMRVWLPVK